MSTRQLGLGLASLANTLTQEPQEARLNSKGALAWNLVHSKKNRLCKKKQVDGDSLVHNTFWGVVQQSPSATGELLHLSRDKRGISVGSLSFRSSVSSNKVCKHRPSLRRQRDTKFAPYAPLLRVAIQAKASWESSWDPESPETTPILDFAGKPTVAPKSARNSHWIRT